MSEIGIPRNPAPTTIPTDAVCQEASSLSFNFYIACARDAVAIVDSRDSNLYYMCLGCADHNCRNRGAKLIMTTDAELQQRHGGKLLLPK